MCFQIDGKSAQAAKCVKSRIINKAIDFVLYTNIFEQKCVVLKRMCNLRVLNIGIKNKINRLINYPEFNTLGCLGRFSINLKRHILFTHWG